MKGVHVATPNFLQLQCRLRMDSSTLGTIDSFGGVGDERGAASHHDGEEEMTVPD